MTATFMEMVTVIFPDPLYNIGQDIRFQLLNQSVSLPTLTTSYIQTLSNAASSAGTDVTGLLYTPDLDAATDPCYNASKPYVPDGVTRQGSLPNENWDLIAVAPWISPECTLRYLAAARQDPRNGFIFFKPNVNDSGIPPGADDPQWSLGDGGQWKYDNKFPVYVVNGAVGYTLMNRSAEYSGNLTSVPYGSILAGAYPPTDYVRLYVDIELNASSSLPPLWVFLLIVLAILAGVIAFSFGLMYYLQYKRRRTLRRRIINGDVDLEALGIQRLIVPQELLDKMPVFEYGTGRSVEPASPTQLNEKGTVVQQTSDGTQPAPTRMRFQDHLNQSTCAICLDDFAVAHAEGPGSTVRQLPCHHIFHPDCVDSFLRENSSLCPMCKSSALPKGYCPKVITNAMVRRERRVRRVRERVSDEDDVPRRRRAGFLSVRSRAQTEPAEVSMTDMAPPTTSTPAQAEQASDTPAPPQGTSRRREWARQRAVAMLGRRGQDADQVEPAEPTSRWRKLFGGVLPGIE